MWYELHVQINYGDVINMCHLTNRRNLSKMLSWEIKMLTFRWEQDLKTPAKMAKQQNRFDLMSHSSVEITNEQICIFLKARKKFYSEKCRLERTDSWTRPLLTSHGSHLRVERHGGASPHTEGDLGQMNLLRGCQGSFCLHLVPRPAAKQVCNFSSRNRAK